MEEGPSPRGAVAVEDPHLVTAGEVEAYSVVAAAEVEVTEHLLYTLINVYCMLEHFQFSNRLISKIAIHSFDFKGQ